MPARKVTKANENIFEALGFQKAEAANLKIRADLMMMVKRYIEKNNLSQTAVAEVMGVDQPRVSKLLAGRIDLFTIDILVQMLEQAGIRIVLKKAA